MTKGILGRKVGTTQIFQEDGTAVPVTVIQVGPCHVLQVRTVDRDGYEAVQLGFLDKPRRLSSRSERGHVAAIGTKCTSRNLKVARIDAENNLLLVRGAVPGPNGGFVVVRETNKVG